MVLISAKKVGKIAKFLNFKVKFSILRENESQTILGFAINMNFIFFF